MDERWSLGAVHREQGFGGELVGAASWRCRIRGCGAEADHESCVGFCLGVRTLARRKADRLLARGSRHGCGSDFSLSLSKRASKADRPQITHNGELNEGVSARTV